MSTPLVLINTISNDCGQRVALEHAVVDVLTGRSGDWVVSLLEIRDEDIHWKVIVEGPDDLQRAWTFRALEQEPAVVCATLERDLELAAPPMGWLTVPA